LYWKYYFEQGTYEAKVLNRFQVKSAVNLALEEKINKNKYDKKVLLNLDAASDNEETDNDTIHSEDSVNDTDSTDEDEDPVPRRIIFTPTISEQPLMKPSTPETQKRQMGEHGSNTKRGVNSNRIHVDASHPTSNVPFLVFPVKDIEGVDGKSYYEGFAIFYQVDMRWIKENEEEDPYTGRVFGSNLLQFKCPAWPYSFLTMHDEIESQVPKNVLDTIEHSQHNYAENPKSSKFKTFMLEFPGGLELASKPIYLEAGENEDLEMDLIDLECDRMDGSSSTSSEMWGCWVVARTDTEFAKRGKVNVQEKKSKAALLLEKLAKKKAGTRPPGVVSS
jgi:hypothetical protein